MKFRKPMKMCAQVLGNHKRAYNQASEVKSNLYETPFDFASVGWQSKITRCSIIQRGTKTLHHHHHRHHHHHHHHQHYFRFFTQSATAALLHDTHLEPPPLTYLEGFPKPDPKFAETIRAIPRSISGKNISSKERKAGRVPSIVFEQEDGQHGGNKRLISVQINQIKKLVNHMGRSFFLSSLFDLEVRPAFDSDEIIEKVRVLPRKLHLHAGTDAVLNVTFLRAPSHALLKVEVPLLYRGEDVSPGLRKGAYLNTIKRTVKYLCPADIVPPYIDVDLSELDVGQKLVMGDLKAHPALKLIQSKDEPVCKIMGSRVSEQQKKSK